MSDENQLREENAKLKKELEDVLAKQAADAAQYDQRLDKERTQGKAYTEQIEQKTAELAQMRSKMVKLNRQLDEEVTRRDMAQAEAQTLACKVQDLSDGTSVPSSGAHGSKGKGISWERDRGAKEDEQGKQSLPPLKILRVIENWMQHKDMQQAMLRNCNINDISFSTIVQVLMECQSLQTLDLAQNQLTMDSCSEICNLITTSPNLSFISLADNLLSLRSVGYFMTAVMERQNTKKLAPLDLLELHGNEGLIAAANAPPVDSLCKQVSAALGSVKLPPRGTELVAQIMRALWRFLHDTQHPQVRNTNIDEVSFVNMDKSTIRKMESALMKLLLLSAEDGDAAYDVPGATRSVTADLVFITLAEVPQGSSPRGAEQSYDSQDRGVVLPPIDSRGQATDASRRAKGDSQRASRPELRDPFSDLKAAFEPPKEKLKTFNLKQIVTRNGTVLMNMLERLLETTEIDARDVETEQTLLEYACQTGNVGLAKLCYRRGANLAARTKKGDTAFNIVTKNQRYDIMEFLHTYGVKVNSCDSKGQTAMHIASSNDDVDAVCRLLEWGADVNLRDNNKRTPLHAAAAGGHFNVTMLLLEVGAEMNAKDDKEYTPTAWAEAMNHFALMDRLLLLGGKGHGLSQNSKGGTLVASKSHKSLGELSVSPQMLKSSSLGRIGKVKVSGLPEPLKASLGK